MVVKPRAELIEDLEFLNETLVGATDAAKRTGFPSAHAMEKWLERHNRSDLWQAMKHRDPEGTHLSGSDRAKRGLSVTTHPLTALLDEAESSTVAKHRRKAERIRSLLAELKVELDADRSRREAEAEARAEVERLQEELADARAALKAAATGKAAEPSGPNPTDARAWAIANNVACPKVGRVPKTVLAAYVTATESAAS